MKILVCIPVMTNVTVFDECLKQVIGKPDVQVMILLNGADSDIREYCKLYQENPDIMVVSNDVNIYVTKAWNYFLNYFITSDYDKLIILNSDLNLCNGWDNIVREHGDRSIVPLVIDDKLALNSGVGSGKNFDAPHPPGICIVLNKAQAKMVYPIPEQIKIWFNDTWIYKILNHHGQMALSVGNFLAFHNHSTTVNATWAMAIIEEDKAAWPEVEKELYKRIAQ